MLEYDAAHGRLKLKGLPQITTNNLAEIMRVLHDQWLIQPQRMAQLRHLTRSGAFAMHLLDGIAGNNVDQQKNHRRRQPLRWESEKEAVK